MSTMGVTKKEEEQFLPLLQSIKEDAEHIKLRLSIANVDLEELTEEEKRDLDAFTSTIANASSSATRAFAWVMIWKWKNREKT